MVSITPVALCSVELSKCFPIISQLRSNLTLTEFLNMVHSLYVDNQYSLVTLCVDGEIKAVAGIRISSWHHTGKYLEIEELVTTHKERSRSYGSQLFDWCKDYAQVNRCNQIRLVSGVSRVRAHAFYLRKGMTFEAKYFSLSLPHAE